MIISTVCEDFLLANPEEAASTLPLSTEELIAIAKESDWGILFEVDRGDVVERLRKIGHD